MTDHVFPRLTSMLIRKPQGEVYARVIKDVVDLSRTDFEEQGVEASALELLQSVGPIRALSFSSIVNQIDSHVASERAHDFCYYDGDKR